MRIVAGLTEVIGNTRLVLLNKVTAGCKAIVRKESNHRPTDYELSVIPSK